ncbi:MAG: hypothetical protein CVU46_02200 [Chloroflexi bacterium HGW-Chloroflexi-8]|jgi:copper chaperone CopZ|nr:MAG: hypothetical protein CVU46_02200 [Chloroflexi bacterium HGW-Chloroflexi-8]
MNDPCKIKLVQRIISEEENHKKQHAYLSISGLNCPNCATRVRNALINSIGVTDAIIDHADGLGEVTFNPDLIRPANFVEIVSKAGGDGVHSYSAMLIE